MFSRRTAKVNDDDDDGGGGSGGGGECTARYWPAYCNGYKV